eukprot:scaffold19916_cov93-Isochrysis_galbana.AAC.1
MAGQAMGMGGAGVGACSTGGLAHTQAQRQLGKVDHREDGGAEERENGVRQLARRVHLTRARGARGAAARVGHFRLPLRRGDAPVPHLRHALPVQCSSGRCARGRT